MTADKPAFSRVSWDACLVDERGFLLLGAEWSYTHNTSPMIYAVLADAGVELPWDSTPCLTVDPETREWVRHPNGRGSISWWKHLDGMSGPEGAAFLHMIVRGLEGEPERFRAMDPPNGWGSYDGLVEVLRAMRNAVPEFPTRWDAGG